MSNDSTDRIRLLTAVPICDGHDSAITTINLELVRRGFEVVYLGFHRPVRDIVRAAIQEGVAGVGISSYNGGHVEFFAEVVAGLKEAGAGHIGVFGGGGGTITFEDADEMQRLCSVYEASDDEGRRLIRLFAELSVSDALQIPPRT